MEAIGTAKINLERGRFVTFEVLLVLLIMGCNFVMIYISALSRNDVMNTIKRKSRDEKLIGTLGKKTRVYALLKIIIMVISNAFIWTLVRFL